MTNLRMTSNLQLLSIQRDGRVEGRPVAFPDLAQGILQATIEMYDSLGYQEPWIGYLAVQENAVVGTCGFKSPPKDNRVEIAYFTFPDFEGRGIATDMASQLLAIAQTHAPQVQLIAQTLLGRNASHRVLEKVGFQCVEKIDHPEDGVVWEWHLCDRPTTAKSTAR